MDADSQCKTHIDPDGQYRKQIDQDAHTLTTNEIIQGLYDEEEQM